MKSRRLLREMSTDGYGMGSGALDRQQEMRTFGARRCRRAGIGCIADRRQLPVERRQRPNCPHSACGRCWMASSRTDEQSVAASGGRNWPIVRTRTPNQKLPSYRRRLACPLRPACETAKTLTFGLSSYCDVAGMRLASKLEACHSAYFTWRGAKMLRV
jgi:hypothetical protein